MNCVRKSITSGIFGVVVGGSDEEFQRSRVQMYEIFDKSVIESGILVIIGKVVLV